MISVLGFVFSLDISHLLAFTDHVQLLTCSIHLYGVWKPICIPLCINARTVGLVTAEAEVISLPKALPSCAHNDPFARGSAYNLSSAEINSLQSFPTLAFLSMFMVMQLMVPPFLQKMPQLRRMSTSSCVWMAPASPWTTTRPVTGPGFLLTPLWLEMTARSMTSGTSSPKHRYHQALLSFL